MTGNSRTSLSDMASGQSPAGPANHSDESAIESFLRILEDHRRACEVTGKYVEAEVAKKRIVELRADHANKKREALRARQVKERLDLEEVQIVEYEQFKTRWAKSLKEFDDKAAEQASFAKDRQAEELLELRERHERELADVRPKPSKEILNLRKIQETLAKQKEYLEAQKVKFKVDHLEALETDRARELLTEAIALAEEKVLTRQAQEMEGLLKRLMGARDDLLRQRQLDHDRIVQKHENRKQLLEKNQALDRQKVEKHLKRGGSTSGSKGLVTAPIDGSRRGKTPANGLTRSVDSPFDTRKPDHRSKPDRRLQASWDQSVRSSKPEFST